MMWTVSSNNKDRLTEEGSMTRICGWGDAILPHSITARQNGLEKLLYPY